MLPIDKVHAIPADIGRIIKPTPITDRGTEVDVAAMITFAFESTDSKIVFRVL